MSQRSRDAAYFEAMYAADPDPWRFRTSAYEAAKYSATVGAIADRRYRSALEVGCSIGVLSQAIAPLCDEVLYFLSNEDIAATAAHVRRSLLPGGRVLLVNWIGEPEPPQPGDRAAEAFLAAAELALERAERADQYRLELLFRPRS
jgi:hypothetical protein